MREWIVFMLVYLVIRLLTWCTKTIQAGDPFDRSVNLFTAFLYLLTFLWGLYAFHLS